MRQAQGTNTTMASKENFEIYNLTTWEVLPHLMPKSERLQHFPEVVPPTTDDCEDYQAEADDGLVQHGLALGREVMAKAAVCGRLRREPQERIRWADVEDD